MALARSTEEWGEIHRELFRGDQPKYSAEGLRQSDMRQILLVLWIAVCARRREMPDFYTPREALSAGWLGIVTGLGTFDPSHHSGIGLRRFLLVQCKANIRQEIYLGYMRATSGESKCMAARGAPPPCDLVAANTPTNTDRSEVADICAMWPMPERISRVAQMHFAEEYTDKEIAAELGMSRHTVRAHITEARAIIGVPNGRRVAIGMPARKPATICSNCGCAAKTPRRGLCGACRTYKTRTGIDRPLALLSGRNVTRAKSERDRSVMTTIVSDA